MTALADIAGFPPERDAEKPPPERLVIEVALVPRRISTPASEA
jgi:hypothetical protein